MNELLLSEIKSDEKGLLGKFLLIDDFMFTKAESFQVDIDNIIIQCQKATENIESALECVETLIDELFVEQMFIDKSKLTWPVISFQIETALAYRTLAPTLKAVILCHVIEACGFESDIVYIPEKTMIRIICDEDYAIIFDPVTGESLDWHQLDVRMNELDGDPSQLELKPIEAVSLVLEHLTALKNALMRELNFDEALKCVDMIIALRPDDPFERRDRGFLLHQLDCFKVAYDDYQYFVEHCPKDPAAQLLKLQLEKITIVDTVLH
ncbi:MAG: regulator of sirC expression with transglutaminase-like and TPR domain [Alteromonadaceae bacterium]|jgi:regulator of sirC expression with transglutaminase-like and TPR domain